MHVNPISKILGLGRRSSDPWSFGIATPQQQPEALAMLLGNDSQLANTRQVRDFIAFATARGVDLSRLRVGTQRGRVRFAILPIVNPGRTALVMSSPLAAGESAVNEMKHLVARLLQDLAKEHIVLVQLLVDPHETLLANFYLACGFERMAELNYLSLPVGKAQRPTLAEGLHCNTYDANTHLLFAQAIADSYEASLDCPRLTGLRNIDDTIRGHMASGEFTPETWWLLQEGDQPLGVVLVNRSPGMDGAELVYLGLSVRGRGRGFGDFLMQQAIYSASKLGVNRLTLAVDAENVPAQRLYFKHGMRKMCSKLAYMLDLRENPWVFPTGFPQSPKLGA